MTKPHCECPQAIDLDTEQAIDAFISGSLRAGTALAGMAMKAHDPDAGIGSPNYSWRSEGPSGQDGRDGRQIRQGVGSGYGQPEGVPTGRTYGSNGNSAKEMTSMSSNPNPGSPRTLDDFSEMLKALNANVTMLGRLVGAAIKAADEEMEEDEEDERRQEDEDEEDGSESRKSRKAGAKAREIHRLRRKLASLEGDPTDAGAEAGSDERDEPNQKRWAEAKGGLSDVLSGRSMYHASGPGALMAAVRGGFDAAGSKAEPLFKSNPAGYILAKARGADAAREVGSWTLEDDMSLESVTACAKAVQHGSCDSHILNLRLRSATEAVRNLLAVTDLLA